VLFLETYLGRIIVYANVAVAWKPHCIISSFNNKRIGVARGCTGCTCTPRAEKKMFWPDLQEKVVSAPPDRARVRFLRKLGEIWTAGVVNLVVLACVLRATTKKGRQLLNWRNNSVPPENPG